MSARPLRSSRPITCVLLLWGLAFGSACASSSERWAEVPVHDLGYTNLYHAVLDLLEVEGFHVVQRDPGAGEILSDWLQGISTREVRGPARRRVHVEIEPIEIDDDDDEEDHYLVRVRVEEQVVRRGGFMSSGPRDESDWEEFDDNFDDAEYLAAKIRALLDDFVRPPAEVTS
jgi:hypothetical protein